MIELNGKLLMFGGIIDITKESDEVFLFDIPSGTWAIVEFSNAFDSLTNSPQIRFTHNLNDSSNKNLEDSIRYHKESTYNKKLKNS